MSWSATQRDLEHLLGLTEVTMIRLPLKDWASPDELKELKQITTSAPLPDGWAELQTKLARRSVGFAQWLRSLSAREWVPDERIRDSERIKADLLRIDFALPWCARLRWGTGNVRNVDVFIHATGGSGPLEWETI